MPGDNIWQTILEDEFYSKFINRDNSENGSQDVALQGLAVADQLKKLEEGIARLDAEIRQQVQENHEDLLQQAPWMEQLETMLGMMQGHVQGLLTAAERLRSRLMEPFTELEKQVAMLARLHATSDLVRRVARVQQLSRRLGGHVAGGDLRRAAASLEELDQLLHEIDLPRLTALQDEASLIAEHRQRVEREGGVLLRQGLAGHSLAQVCNAVQILAHLNCLWPAVEQLVKEAEEAITQGIKTALNVHTLTQNKEGSKGRGGPGRVAMVAPGSTAEFRARLWAALEHLFDATIYTQCVQVDTLQRALLVKPRDASSYVDLLPEVSRTVAENFWERTSRQLAARLAEAAQSSTYIKQALEGEFPTFLALYQELCRKLRAAGGSFTVSREVVQPFENAYLSCSVSRLLNPIHNMFTGDSVPSTEQVEALVHGVVTNELSVSLVDESLSRLVARNISKAVRLFCLRCEQVSSLGGDATQVVDSPTPGQLLNASLANAAHHLSMQVSRVLTNMQGSLSPDAAATVQESLSAARALGHALLSALLASVGDAIEAIVLTMHQEDFSREDGGHDGCSLYMRELQSFVLRASRSYLQPYNDRELVQTCATPVVERAANLFLRHACLVRPLGSGGRARLLADCATLEVALAPLAPAPRCLRWLRPLLMLPPSEVARLGQDGAGPPPSLMLMALFSHGPPELPSPQQSAGWSLSRYSQWCDTHPRERERLELIGGALQRYQQTVRQRGDASFHEVYPVMLAVLERGLAECVT